MNEPTPTDIAEKRTLPNVWESLTPPYSTIVADPPWHYDEQASAAGLPVVQEPLLEHAPAAGRRVRSLAVAATQTVSVAGGPGEVAVASSFPPGPSSSPLFDRRLHGRQLPGALEERCDLLGSEPRQVVLAEREVERQPDHRHGTVEPRRPLGWSGDGSSNKCGWSSDLPALGSPQGSTDG